MWLRGIKVLVKRNVRRTYIRRFEDAWSREVEVRSWSLLVRNGVGDDVRQRDPEMGVGWGQLAVRWRAEQRKKVTKCLPLFVLHSNYVSVYILALQSWLFGLVWFGFVWFYGTSTIVGYLMLNLFLYTQTVLFQTIQFSISTQFSSIWLLDRTLSSATTQGQAGAGSDVNKGVLHIPQAPALLEPYHQIV